jgi:hypothetical protein
MGQAIVRIADLPAAPLEAAAQFYANIGLWAGEHKGKDMALVFPQAAAGHRAWRLAAVQDMARQYAPCRTNAVVGDEPEKLDQMLAYLAAAPGITGQVFELDGNTAQGSLG